MFSIDTPTPIISNVSLYTNSGERKYLNQTERQRFLDCANEQEPMVRLLCHVLVFTGCRLSEALELSKASLYVPEEAILVRSLKKRDLLSFRLIPVPQHLIKELHDWAEVNPFRLFALRRTRGLYYVKKVMRVAEIDGVRATARGLRHTFGAHAIHSGIPLTLLQRWYGHSKLETTAIYTQILGQEERQFAERMW